MLFNNSICTIVKVLIIYLSCKKTSIPNLFDLLHIEGISSIELRRLAYESGLIKRTAKKIDIIDFLTLMCLESQKGSPSYNDLATRFDTVCKTSPSKQAISKKINPACVQFFQSVLECIITSKMRRGELDLLKTDSYGRLLVQDSTILKLPQKLFKIYSGVSNGHSMVCNARIQGIYDLLSGSFVSFSIDTYTKNDIITAPELELRKGDLTLRDRGYFTIAEVNRHIDTGSDFIYRYKHKILVFNAKTGQQIDLAKLLKAKGSIDMEVHLNDDRQLKVRLIAEPVTDQVANMRRRRAKLEYKTHNPSGKVLELMGWTIFITSIPKEQADFQKILLIYGLRWRIEIIFKAWKSHMHFAKLHNVSENQLRVLLTSRFIMIVICMEKIYIPCYQRILSKYTRQISLLKLLSYLMKNPEKIMEILSIKTLNNKRNKPIDQALVKYCTYDRRSRLNFNQYVKLVIP